MEWNFVKNFTEANFKRLTGVDFFTFNTLLEHLQDAKREDKNTGAPPSLSDENQLLLTLSRYRDYPTYFRLGAEFGVSESTAQRVFESAEKILLQIPEFQDVKLSLPDGELPDVFEETAAAEQDEGNADAEKSESPVLLVDATEIVVERPKRNQEENYSGKKKRIRKKH